MAATTVTATLAASISREYDDDGDDKVNDVDDNVRNTTTTTTTMCHPSIMTQNDVMLSSSSSSPLPRSLDVFLTQACHELSFHADNDDDEAAVVLGRNLQQQQQQPHWFYDQWRYWIILFGSLGVANASDASEILCLSFVLSDASFQQTMLEPHAAWRGGCLAAAVFSGMLVGGIVLGGNGGDVWGRRRMLLAGLCTNSIAGWCAAGAWNVYVLVACRFVAGVGIGTTVPPLFALCSELAPPLHRGWCVTVAASFWMVGSLYVSIVAWCLWGRQASGNNDSASNSTNDVDDDTTWRLFMAWCAIPSTLGFLLVWYYVPESPRFALLQHDYAWAVDIVNDLAHDRLRFTGPLWTMAEAQTCHGAPSGILQPFHHDRHRHHHPMERRGRSSCSDTLRVLYALLCDFVQSSAQLYVPQLMARTLSLQLVWFSVSFGSYGLYTWINTLYVAVHMENVYWNSMLFAVSNLPGNLLSAYGMDVWGRCRMLTGSIVAASLSLVVFAYAAWCAGEAITAAEASSSASSSSPPPSLTYITRWIVISSCVFQMCISIAWNAMDIIAAEQFPTAIRTTGMGLCSATGRVGALVAQWVNGAWLVHYPAILVLVAAATLSLGAWTPACGWLRDPPTAMIGGSDGEDPDAWMEAALHHPHVEDDDNDKDDNDNDNTEGLNGTSTMSLSLHAVPAAVSSSPSSSSSSSRLSLRSPVTQRRHAGQMAIDHAGGNPDEPRSTNPGSYSYQRLATPTTPLSSSSPPIMTTTTTTRLPR